MGVTGYIMLGLSIAIMLLGVTVGIEYAVIKNLQEDKDQLKTELRIKEELQAGLYRDREITSTELATCQVTVTACREKNKSNKEALEEYKENILSICTGNSSRLRASWQACEDKLRDASGGTYEKCEEIIARSIDPYYY